MDVIFFFFISVSLCFALSSVLQLLFTMSFSNLFTHKRTHAHTPLSLCLLTFPSVFPPV